jgi:hypothetical protein
MAWRGRWRIFSGRLRETPKALRSQIATSRKTVALKCHCFWRLKGNGEPTQMSDPSRLKEYPYMFADTRAMVFSAIFFGALSILGILGVWEKVRTSALTGASVSHTLWYGGLALSATSGAATVSALLAWHRYHYPHRIVIMDVGVLVPKALWSKRSELLEYVEISRMDVSFTWTLDRVLSLKHPTGVYKIREICLPMAAFGHIEQEIRTRRQQAKLLADSLVLIPPSGGTVEEAITEKRPDEPAH